MGPRKNQMPYMAVRKHGLDKFWRIVALESVRDGGRCIPPFPLKHALCAGTLCLYLCVHNILKLFIEIP